MIFAPFGFQSNSNAFASEGEEVRSDTGDQELKFGDTVHGVTQIALQLEEGEEPILAEVNISATVTRNDTPFGGMIDGLKPILTTPENFNPLHFPDLVRTHTIHQLLKHRAEYLKPFAETFGAKDRDFRAIASLKVRYPVERFPYFNGYYEQLSLNWPKNESDVEQNKIDRRNQNRFTWILLHHSAKIYRSEIKVLELNEKAEKSRLNSVEFDKGIIPDDRPSPELRTAIEELAKWSEFAPRLLEVGRPQSKRVVGVAFNFDVQGRKTLHRRLVSEIFEKLDASKREILFRDLNQFDAGADPASMEEYFEKFSKQLHIARNLTYEHILVSLNANREALRHLTETNLEENLDDLIFASPIIQRILSTEPMTAEGLTYGEFLPVFKKAHQDWVRRVQKRILKRQVVHTVAGVALGLLSLGVWVPASWVVPFISITALRWGALISIMGLSTQAWIYYWDMRRSFMKQRALFEGAWFVMPLGRYKQLQKNLKEAHLRAYTEAIFALTFVFAGYGQLMAIQNSGPLGMLHLIHQTRAELNGLKTGANLNRFRRMRIFFAESRLAKLEGKLQREVQRLQGVRNPNAEQLGQLNFGKTILESGERPMVQFMDNRFWPRQSGLGIQSIAERTVEMRAAVPMVPNPFSIPQWRSAFSEMREIMAGLRLRSQQEGGFRTLGKILKETFTDRDRYQWAINIAGINTVLAFVSETVLREGDIFDEGKLFGRFSLPKKGAMFTMGITFSTLTTMAFSAKIGNPILRPLLPMLVAGGNAFLFQRFLLDRDLDEVDAWRVAYDMGFNVLGSWYSVAPQIWASTALTTRMTHMDPRIGYLANKGIFLGAGFGVMIIYSTAALFFFETAGMECDLYGNFYRDLDDIEPWHQPLEGY